MDRIKIKRFEFLKNCRYYTIVIIIDYDDKKITINDSVYKFSSIDETQSKLLRAVILYEEVNEELEEIKNIIQWYKNGYYENGKKKLDEKIIEKANFLLK